MVAKIGTEVPERPVGTGRGQRGGTAGCLADKGEHAALATGGRVAGEGTAGPRFCSAVCFYGWYQQRRCEVAQQLGVAVEAQLAAALAEVGRDDLDGVGIAAVCVDLLAAYGGPDRLTQLAVCGFLWYQLPAGDTPRSERWRMAVVLGRLFEALGLSRYAALCTSPVTAAVMRTFDERGVSAGREAYQRALHRCGIVPPDVAELTWGTVMGVEETDAYEATAAMLEIAVVAGRLRPGTTGWRTRQAEMTTAYVTAADPALGGACRLDRIRAERLAVWARCRGEQRRRSLAGLMGRLTAAGVVASDADEYLAPVRWLLERAGTADGLPLTGAHRLDHTVAVEAYEWFGPDCAAPGPTGIDGEGSCLRALRELLGSMGAVRRTGRRLVLTPLGRRLSAEPADLWAAAVGCLIGDDDTLGAATTEAAMVVLVDGRQIGREELTRRVSTVLAGEGWRDPTTGRPPSGPAVRTALADLWRTLRALGLLADDHWLRPLRLSPIGQAAAVAALRARAMRPRHTIGSG